MEQTRKFSFSMPIVKAYIEKGTNKRILEGVASNTAKDLHGDRMSPAAIESMADSIKALKKKSGTLNAEHEKSWQSELGEITELKVSSKKELIMKAELNETSKANDLWYMLTEKKKKLGLSIGGFVKSFRIEIDEKSREYMRVFEEVILDHIAVTSQPANPNTWVSAIAKSVNGVQLNAMQNQEEVVFNLLNEEEMTKNKAQDTELEKDAEETTAEETAEETKIEETQNTVSEGEAGSEDETTSEGEATEATTEETTEEAPADKAEATEEESKEEATEGGTDEEAGESTETVAEGDKPGDEEKSFATKDDLEAMKSAILSEIKSLIGKSETTEESTEKSEEESKEEGETTEKSVDEEKTTEEEVEKSAIEKDVEFLKSEVERLNKVAVTKRKTAVEAEKFEGDGNVELSKENMDKELAEVEKTFSADPQKVFVKKGEIRRKYAKLGIR